MRRDLGHQTIERLDVDAATVSHEPAGVPGITVQALRDVRVGSVARHEDRVHRLDGRAARLVSEHQLDRLWRLGWQVVLLRIRRGRRWGIGRAVGILRAIWMVELRREWPAQHEPGRDLAVAELLDVCELVREDTVAERAAGRILPGTEQDVAADRHRACIERVRDGCGVAIGVEACRRRDAAGKSRSIAFELARARCVRPRGTVCHARGGNHVAVARIDRRAPARWAIDTVEQPLRGALWGARGSTMCRHALGDTPGWLRRRRGRLARTMLLRHPSLPVART